MVKSSGSNPEQHTLLVVVSRIVASYSAAPAGSTAAVVEENARTRWIGIEPAVLSLVAAETAAEAVDICTYIMLWTPEEVHNRVTAFSSSSLFFLAQRRNFISGGGHSRETVSLRRLDYSK